MARTLYVPSLGDAVVLAEDWTFPLQAEGRNKSLWEALGLPTLQPSDWWLWEDRITSERKQELINAGLTFSYGDINTYSGNRRMILRGTATLPKGTVLAIDRIYIRKGAKEYNSVTFFVRETTIPHKKQLRFWVSLPDANRMVIEDAILPPAVKKPRPKKTLYYFWVRYTADQIAKAKYLQDRIAEYDTEFATGVRRRYPSYGPEWMNNPRYTQNSSHSERTPDAFVEAMKKKYGDLLKCVSVSGYYPTPDKRIYEAP